MTAVCYCYCVGGGGESLDARDTADDISVNGIPDIGHQNGSSGLVEFLE